MCLGLQRLGPSSGPARPNVFMGQPSKNYSLGLHAKYGPLLYVSEISGHKEKNNEVSKLSRCFNHLHVDLRLTNIR